MANVEPSAAAREALGVEAVTALVTEIETFKTQFDVFRFMKRLVERYFSRTFMVVNMPSVTSRELSPNSIITNWPADLLTEYDGAAMLTRSTILERLRRSSTPLQYDMDDAAAKEPSDNTSSVKALFHRFNMNRGAYFPVHDAGGTRGAVSLHGNRSAFSAAEMIELSYISIHVYNRLAQIRDMDVRTSDVLTEREIDCLNWTSAGKTSVEIAEILGLSEHTINHYLNRATKKLDAVNRTQAVAKAIRSGLIK
ncbi:autoinducer binding domain-containing protein [Peteryoungia desertarenae]|uniref:Autoinducer binding domain-containing protein n=1 Tax=Peteryoungia desertarenae TaxID=1813451 RepID=A0ABX6QLW6_9HYPH|nr:autoinducer binding domain-containing protein [Peteryoungia desertarenae]QLF69539.1 autoinducer binding domain-containing protein [Peteryoungia desertarenae]